VIAYNQFDVNPSSVTEAPEAIFMGGPVFTADDAFGTGGSAPLLTKSGGSIRTTGVTSGGSADGVYGDGHYGQGVAHLPAAPANNGYLNLRTGVSNAAATAQFTFTNNAPFTLWLTRVLFDAININNGALTGINWLVTSGGSPVASGAITPPGNVPLTLGWKDYSYAAGISVAPSQRLDVTFVGSGIGASSGNIRQIGLDNIAFVVIPEPGNVLALCGLLGSAALIRRRRGVSAPKASAALIPAV
jgi:hypothetical protein